MINFGDDRMIMKRLRQAMGCMNGDFKEVQLDVILLCFFSCRGGLPLSL